jgi:hypothetical protein
MMGTMTLRVVAYRVPERYRGPLAETQIVRPTRGPSMRFHAPKE